MMKNKFTYLFLFVGALCFSTLLSSAQTADADWIKGTWLTESGKTKIYIYKAKNGKYYGKVTWLSEPNDANGKPLKDINNPDETKRKEEVKGALILRSFVYDAEDKEWVDGTLYKYDEGDTYTGYMKKNEDGTLYLRGYVAGMRFLGKTSTWTRVK